MKLVKFHLAENERGLGRFGLLVLVLILVSGLYVGYHVLPFYYYYFEIQGLMDAQAEKASMIPDHKIRRELIKRINKLEIPVQDMDDDLKINRFNGKIVIDLKYKEILYVDLEPFGFGEDSVYDLHVFKFNPHVEREY